MKTLKIKVTQNELELLLDAVADRLINLSEPRTIFKEGTMEYKSVKEWTEQEYSAVKRLQSKLLK